jgi:hypothetical protein
MALLGYVTAWYVQLQRRLLLLPLLLLPLRYRCRRESDFAWQLSVPIYHPTTTLLLLLLLPLRCLPQARV